MDPQERKKILQDVLDRIMYVEGFVDKLQKVIDENPVKKKINYEAGSFKIPQS